MPTARNSSANLGRTGSRPSLELERNARRRLPVGPGSHARPTGG
jgi:hypothetical protein